MKIVIDVPEQLIRTLKETGLDWLGAEHALNAISEGQPLSEVIDKISAEGKYVKKEEALLAVTDALKKCFACFDKYDTWWLYNGTKLSLTKAIDSISVVHVEDRRVKCERFFKKLRRWLKKVVSK